MLKAKWILILILTLGIVGCDAPSNDEKLGDATKTINFRGKLYGIGRPDLGGKVGFYIEMDSKLYDLRFTADSKFIGDKDGAFQLGHFYDVTGIFEDKKFILKGLGTIVVHRISYAGKP